MSYDTALLELEKLLAAIPLPLEVATYFMLAAPHDPTPYPANGSNGSTPPCAFEPSDHPMPTYIHTWDVQQVCEERAHGIHGIRRSAHRLTGCQSANSHASINHLAETSGQTFISSPASPRAPPSPRRLQALKDCRLVGYAVTRTVESNSSWASRVTSHHNHHSSMDVAKKKHNCHCSTTLHHYIAPRKGACHSLEGFVA